MDFCSQEPKKMDFLLQRWKKVSFSKSNISKFCTHFGFEGATSIFAKELF
jgi:hypothetical protein